jgi:hypothetical protein
MRPEIIVAYLSSVSALIPFVFAVIKRKDIPRELLPLLVILALSVLADLLSFVLANNSINTYPIGNLYLFITFLLLSYIYFKSLRQPKHLKWTVVVFSIFFVLNFLFWEGPFKFNSYSNVAASLILIFTAIWYLTTLLRDLPTADIQLHPLLWITFAVLFYYGGTFFLFLVKNYLTYGDSGSHRMMWILHNSLNIIKNGLFAFGLWQSSRKVNSSISS